MKFIYYKDIIDKYIIYYYFGTFELLTIDKTGYSKTIFSFEDSHVIMLFIGILIGVLL